MALIYEKKDKLAYFTLNRPEALNSFDPELAEEFSRALIDFRDDPDAWVAIVTGAGERAFSAGADLVKMIPKLMDKKASPPYREPPTIMRGLDIWKPFIAAINGAALGGGMELALACDIRIAAEHATFGQPEVRWSVIPGWGGTQRLPRVIPLAKAAEMLLTGKPIDAKEALRVGLINAVVPKDKLMATAEDMARGICELGTLGVRACKEAMMRGLSMSLDAGLHLEKMLFDSLKHTEDVEEGPRAFKEKRKPQFKGR